MNASSLASEPVAGGQAIEMMTTVAIVEDDSSVRRTMINILQRAPGIRCVGDFGSGEEALREIPLLAPQVVVMDINLSGMTGVECVQQLARLNSKTQFIMLTVHDDIEAIFDSLSAGAGGYLLKPVRTAELIAAVRDVYAGGAPMTSHIARKVVQSFKQPTPPAAAGETLSPREIEILDYLAKGHIYKQIADALGISYRTVGTHIEHIYKKLHVRSRSQAVAKFHRL